MKKIETLIPKTEVTMTKKAKVTIFFRPTVLHDHAASQLVKNYPKRPFLANPYDKTKTTVHSYR